jgi:hypothetical protein
MQQVYAEEKLYRQALLEEVEGVGLGIGLARKQDELLVAKGRLECVHVAHEVKLLAAKAQLLLRISST